MNEAFAIEPTGGRVLRSAEAQKESQVTISGDFDDWYELNDVYSSPSSVAPRPIRERLSFVSEASLENEKLDSNSYAIGTAGLLAGHVLPALLGIRLGMIPDSPLGITANNSLHALWQGNITGQIAPLFFRPKVESLQDESEVELDYSDLERHSKVEIPKGVNWSSAIKNVQRYQDLFDIHYDFGDEKPE